MYLVQKPQGLKRFSHSLMTLGLKKALPVLVSAATLITTNTYAQSVSGKVVDSHGKPVANANISLGNKLQKIQTDEQGSFSFTEVNQGDFELHVSAKNYSHVDEVIEVGTKNIDGLNLVLSRSVIEVIDVHATPLHASNIESALPINVIGEDELKMKQAATLGETLKNEVGVHSSYYGPVASTPIIRGLDGPRVLITQNGLDVGDASRVGPDHVVATEASTATQIEVLRGPATLFYGSGAIGGVVNVVDQRVPTSSEDKFDYLLQYNDVSNEQQASFNLQTGTENIAFHLDGFWRDSEDYKIAGPADIHDEEGGHDEDDHDEDHEGEHADADDERLANSASSSYGGTFGTSYLLENGFVGMSYGYMNREYGIPGHNHGHDEHEEDHDEEEHEEEGHEEELENVFAKMKQNKWQLLSEYNFDEQFIDKLSAKFSYTDYQHQEIEVDEIGTTFNNESVEARVDFFHRNVSGWKGAWTVHYKYSDFEAIGEEAFAPPSQSDMIALAWLEEKHFGPVLLQLGARVEHVSIDADDTDIGFEHGHEEHEEEHEAHEEEELHEAEIVSFEQQSFTPVSLSAGLVWDYAEGYNIGVSTAMSQRAPSAAELFSFGPHIGTNTFEVGALFDLHQEGDEIHVELAEEAPQVETSLNLDITVRKFNGDFGYVISAFYNRVDDYYYQQDTGLLFEEDHDDAHTDVIEEEEEGLPILVFQQNDVEMYGGEAEFIYQMTPAFKMSVFTDYIRARLVNTDGNDNLPRIPPLRIGGMLNYQGNSFDSALSVTHYFDQEDVAELETTTDGYSMLDANLNYYLDGIGNDFVLYVKGENLTDEHARVHSSFLKDVAPLPGRNLSVGIRGSF